MGIFSVLVHTPARIIALSFTAAMAVNATLEFLLLSQKNASL